MSISDRMTSMYPNAHPREKRKFGRRWMTCHAWITINRRRRTACTVINISERGALLGFDGVVPSANRFRLKVEDPFIEVDCDVRHRTGHSVGVFFAAVVPQEDLEKPPTGNELVARLRSEA